MHSEYRGPVKFFISIVCIYVMNCGCTCSSTLLRSDGDSDSGPDTSSPSHTTVTITNAGPGPAYLEGGYRHHCLNILGMYRTESGDDRILHPTVAFCRCGSCESDACMGPVSWEIHYLELPEGSAIQFEWDRLRWDFVSGGCDGTGCFQSSEAEPGRYEVRVHYNRTEPACPDGESTLPPTYLVPQGFQLPQDLVYHLCNDGFNTPSLFCFDLDLTAAAEFDLEDAEVEVVLR